MNFKLAHKDERSIYLINDRNGLIFGYFTYHGMRSFHIKNLYFNVEEFHNKQELEFLIDNIDNVDEMEKIDISEYGQQYYLKGKTLDDDIIEILKNKDIEFLYRRVNNFNREVCEFITKEPLSNDVLTIFNLLGILENT